MAIFGPKPWLTPLEKCQFFDFLNELFFQPRKAFFVLEYRKRDFPGLYCLKKKVGKMFIFVLKQRVNPFKKCQFLEFLNFFFLQARKAFFSFQNIVKDMFLVYITQKKVGKMAIFGPKPWVNPFRENVNFSTF